MFRSQAGAGSAVDDPEGGVDDPDGGNTDDLGSFGDLFRVPHIHLRRVEEGTIQRSVPAPRELPKAFELWCGGMWWSGM